MKISQVRNFLGIQHSKKYMMEHYYQNPFYFDQCYNNDIHLVFRL